MLIASEIRTGSSGASLMHGFRKAGWDVQDVNYRDYFIQSGTFAARVVARLTRGIGVASFNAAILEVAGHVHPDVFMMVKGVDVAAETLKALAARGVKLVNFYPDVHFSHKGVDVASFPLLDLFVTTKSFQMDYLRKRLAAVRVAFVHHGYSDEAQYPRLSSVAESDYQYDVTYVGNHTPYKERWLAAVAERLPHVKLCVIGDRWESSQSERLRRCALGHVLYGDFYARAIQLSKINLALHAGPTGTEGWEDLVSTRTFEIPACKGFMLHIDNAEIRDVFEPETEIGVFDSEAGMLERIEFYLARPELRAGMIEHAFQRCVPAYGYDARAKQISDFLTTL